LGFTAVADALDAGIGDRILGDKFPGDVALERDSSLADDGVDVDTG